MAQFNVNDLALGFDPTGSSSITGAQLGQLISNASPSSDRGFVLLSTDSSTGDPNVPNASATGTTAWQRFIWLRITAASTNSYVWNPNGSTSNYTNPTTGIVTSLLNWTPMNLASIGAGSITGSQIAAGTITSSNISSTGIPSSFITGNVPSTWVSTASNDGKLITSSSPIYGTVSGTINATTLSKQSITGSNTALEGKIADGSVYALQLATNTIVSANMLKSTLGNNYATSTSGAIGNLGGVDPGCNLSVPAKSLVGIPSTSNYSASTSGSNVIPGDILAVNATSSAGQVGGFATVRRAILSLADPATGTSTAGQVITVNSGNTGFTYAAAPSPAAGTVSGSLTLGTSPIANRTITNIQIAGTAANGLSDSANSLSNSGVAPQTLNGVDPFNNISVPAKSVPGKTYSSATGTWSNVAAGDVLVVNNAKSGYVTNNRAVLTLNDPGTGVSTVGQTIVVDTGNAALKYADVTPAKQTTTGSLTTVTGAITDRTITNIQLYTSAGNAAGLQDATNSQSNSGVLPATGALNAVDPFNNISVPAKSVPGQTYSSAIGTWGSVVAGDVLVVNNALTGYVTNKRAILTLAEPSASTTTPQVPMAAGSSAVYAITNPQGNSNFGRVLNSLFVTDTNWFTCTYATNSSQPTNNATSTGPSTTRPSFTTTPSGATAALSTNTVANIPTFNAANTSFTPVSSSSTIIVEVNVNLGNNSSTSANVVALFQGLGATATSSVAATSSYINVATTMQNVTLKYIVGSHTAGTPINFQVAVGAITGTIYYNTASGASTGGFNGNAVSTFSVIEYL